MGSNPGEEADSEGHADGGAGHSDPGFDEVVLYRVVRKAMEDAILGAVGTLLLVGVAFVLVGVGVSMTVQAGDGTSVVIGVAIILFGLYVAGATLELIPPVRDWL